MSDPRAAVRALLFGNFAIGTGVVVVPGMLADLAHGLGVFGVIGNMWTARHIGRRGPDRAVSTSLAAILAGVGFATAVTLALAPELLPPQVAGPAVGAALGGALIAAVGIGALPWAAAGLLGATFWLSSRLRTGH